MGGFWQLLCRLGRRLYPSLYTRAADHAMDRLLRDVLLPLYLRQLSPSTPSIQGSGPSASPLTQESDPRVVALLCGYGPSLWRLFRLYAVSPMGPMPRHLHFPDDAQQSEVGFHDLVYDTQGDRHPVFPDTDLSQLFFSSSPPLYARSARLPGYVRAYLNSCLGRSRALPTLTPPTLPPSSASPRRRS